LRQQRSDPDGTEDDARKAIIAEFTKRLVTPSPGEGPLKEFERHAGDLCNPTPYARSLVVSATRDDSAFNA
jgi:hypothetical protein